MKKIVVCLLSLLLFVLHSMAQENSWIRINQLGYPTKSGKVAVWCSKQAASLSNFELVEAGSQKTVLTANAGKPFGGYGPFQQTYRLDFSRFTKPGRYFLRTGNTRSPEFSINDDVYKGTADFCLRYMRQQRSGFNPFLKDSCHAHDGYTLYGPMKDSTHIDVSGGWHDASDYLQYSTTSANATWHLLAAYRDFGKVFGDQKLANGLDGKNGMADILDEAKWGLDWLSKMHPRPDWLFNQLGDDRDHMGMRIPKEDSFYGRGFERPVYFVSGLPQMRGKFMNNTTGTSSTAARFSSAFALGSETFRPYNSVYADTLRKKSFSSYAFAMRKPGVSQTASVRSPYIYAEENWVDDMELAATANGKLTDALGYAKQEPLTPWLGADTAKHYQWYPFINIGHYETAKKLASDPAKQKILTGYYYEGINRVWQKARNNAFYRGIPFIWCSNNLTTSFAIQCYWYRQLTGDNGFAALEQANIDWLFGCNPWGTSMVYGLPAWGDTPVDPHSAFTHLKNYPIDGGLVDGPVYTSIYKGLIGITLKDPDEYAHLQSELAVYHDDYGDYSSNEPTMDGTASLIYLMAARENENNSASQVAYGAYIRGDSAQRKISLVFTGDEFGEGLGSISGTLKKHAIRASFFFTGNFYRNPSFRKGILALYDQHHLLGPHSDKHLLYNDWTTRSKTLVSKDSLIKDFAENRSAMLQAGIREKDLSPYFIPPYEWWNEEISGWLNASSIKLFSFTPGTASNADYTWPEMGNSYRSSDAIIRSLKSFNETKPGKLNGAILLLHAGTDPRRKDKLYNRLDELIVYLKSQGYTFTRIDELLK